MRRTITRLVSYYKKRLGVTIPVHVHFTYRHIRPPAVSHVTINIKTGKATSATISIDPTHFERTESKSKELSNIYLRYAVSHEVAHIREVERLGSKTFNVSRKKLESYADRKAFEITKHGVRETQGAIDRLQRRFKAR